MQVSTQVNTAYSPIDTSSNTQNKDLDPKQEETLKELKVLKVHNESKQAQIDAYVAGTQQANDTNDDYVQNSTDFASDLRQSNNYTTLVENGLDISELEDKPEISPLPNISELDEDQQSTAKALGVSGLRQDSKEAQLEAYKAGTESADNSFDETAKYVEEYNQFAADVRRSDALNTYVENNNYLVG